MPRPRSPSKENERRRKRIERRQRKTSYSPDRSDEFTYDAKNVEAIKEEKHRISQKRRRNSAESATSRGEKPFEAPEIVSMPPETERTDKVTPFDYNKTYEPKEPERRGFVLGASMELGSTIKSVNKQLTKKPPSLDAPPPKTKKLSKSREMPASREMGAIGSLLLEDSNVNQDELASPELAPA